jgi:bifunctional non-homologous end joining protein LigD
MSRVGGQLGFIEPQLLTSVDQPPQGDEWLHEINHDGYRTLLVVEGGLARAYTRPRSDRRHRLLIDRWGDVPSLTLQSQTRDRVE